MVNTSLVSRHPLHMYTQASNLYYTYSAACNLVEFPKKIHSTFTLIGMYSCLDFFPAIGRVRETYNSITKTSLIKNGALLISEISSMCVDVIWVIDGLKEFKVVSSRAIPWAPVAYKILTPLGYLWLPDSLHTTYRNCREKKFTKEVALDLAGTINNLIYYGTYIFKPTPAIHSVQLACCISTLVLSLFQP